MHRSIRTAALLATLALAGCERAPVVIGIANGTLPTQGAILALEDARAAGLPVPVEPVVVPAANTLAAPAVQAADTIVSTPGVIAVLGHSNSAASLTAAPIYNEAGVVQLATHSTAELYSEAGPYSFRMVPPDGQQGRLIAEFIVSEFAGHRVALSYINDDYGRGLRAAVLTALPDGAVQVPVDVPHIEMATPDMIRRTTLTILDARPDVILWLSRAPQLADYLPGLRDSLGDVPIVGGDGMIPAEAFAAGNAIWRNIHFVRLVDLDARPGTRRFRERFRERFGADPDDAAALAYDGMAVLLEGVRDGARTGEGMRRYLMSLGRDRPAFQGITGPLTFDDDGDAARDYVMAGTGARSGR